MPSFPTSVKSCFSEHKRTPTGLEFVNDEGGIATLKWLRSENDLQIIKNLNTNASLFSPQTPEEN
ncbi:hypothetical protein EDS67_08770 [candidate division KSB1 bacterium]|nr:MAG: hypothetical protein EDS67_08770 [candidate division KSB1 bacterium]MBC6950288.1 hypothetical protein [candidate division KSB1 bacterium]MCE7942786.1 hypothetical protein [Chlorobi bacterium CHB1]RIK75158.1 MAG: hypothetical protein DCC62_13885 [candidate division KSB1 bacterium]